MCSPSRSPLPPPSPPNPSRSSQCTRSERLSHASNLGWWSVSPLIVYMFRCCPLETSHPRLLHPTLAFSRVYFLTLSCIPFVLRSKSLQLCPSLHDPMGPPGSSVHGILQMRILEWVANSFSHLSYMFIFMPVPHSLDYSSFEVNLKYNFVLSWDCFGYSGPLKFLCEF